MSARPISGTFGDIWQELLEQLISSVLYTPAYASQGALEYDLATGFNASLVEAIS
jgi:hypothetical protein